MYSRTNTFGAELHESNIRIKKYYNKYENGELDWKTNFFFQWFAYQVQSHWNTDEDERTFGTPCKCTEISLKNLNVLDIWD